MKKFITGTCAGIALASTIALAASYMAEDASFKVFVNGEEFTSSKAVVIDGSTYLPLRAIGDALGVPVNWNDESKQVEVGTTAANTNSDTATAKGYSFTQLSVTNLTDGVTTAKVDVTNNTGSTKSSVIFTVSFYDENNNRIGSATGAIANEFANGETVTVQLVSSENINAYDHVRYQVDIEY